MADINFSVAVTGLAGVQGGIASLSQTFNGVSNSAQSLGTRMRDIGNSISDFGRSAQSIGRSLLPITGVIGGVGLAAVKLSSDFEQARIAFSTMLGSAREGDRFLRQLADFAKRTPFQFTELQEAAKRMMALGFESKQVIPTLRIIGDAVAGLGSGSEGINRITLALGQMQAKGKVTAEEMRQLAEAGIPAWEILANKIGVSIPEAMEMARKGMISASVAIPAILEGMNERFGGLMQKQAQTIGGIWSNLVDSIKLNLVSLGNDIVRIFDLKGVLVGITQFADRVTSEWARLDDSTKKIVLVMAGLAAAIPPVLIGLGALSVAVGAAVTGFGILMGVLSPLTLAVAGLAAAWVAFGTPLRDINSVISATSAELTFFGGVIQSTIGGIVAVTSVISQWASSLGGTLLQALSGAGQAILQFFGNLPQMAVNGLNALTAFVLGVFQNLGGRISESMSGWGESIRSALGKIGNVFAQVFGGILTLVSTFINRIREWMVGRLTSIMDSVKGTLTKVRGYFQELYNDVVGSSIIPDMVRAIGRWMNQELGIVMDEGTRKATEKARENFERFFGQMRSSFEVFSDHVGSTLQFSQRTIAERLGEIVVEGGKFKDAFTGIWQEIKKSFVASIADMAMEWSKRKLFDVMTRDLTQQSQAMSASMSQAGQSMASSLGAGFIAKLGAIGLAAFIVHELASTAKRPELVHIGAGIGAVVGFAFGGPFGAAIGATIGGALGRVTPRILDWARQGGGVAGAALGFAMGGPFGAAVGAMLGRNMSSIMDWARRAASGIADAFRRAAPIIAAALAPAVAGAVALFRRMGIDVGAIMDRIRGIISTVANAIRTIFGGAFNAIASAARTFGAVLSSIFNAIRAVVQAVANAIRTIFGGMFASVTGLARSFGATFGGILRGVQSVATSIINGIRSAFAAAFNAITAAARSFGSAFTSVLRGVQSAALAIMNAIRSGFIAAFNAITSAARAFVGAFRSALQGLVSVAQSVAGGILSAFRGAFSSIASAASSMVSSVGGALSGLLGRARDVAGQVSGLIGDAVSGITSGEGTIGNIADGVRDFFGFAQGGIVTAPTLGLIGEAGEPEAVIPLSRAKEFGFGSGGKDVHLHFHGPVIFDELTFQQFVRRVKDEMRRDNMRFA